MNTKSKVAKAAADLAGDPGIEKDVSAEISNNEIVSRLLSLRVSKQITQEKLAQSMGCDPSKISRIESGNDASLKWGDFLAYLGALDVGATLVLEDRSLPAAERIKHYVLRIHKDLEELAALAKEVGGDDEISQKIHQFYGEVLLNFLLRYSGSYAKLKSIVQLPSGGPQTTATDRNDEQPAQAPLTRK